MNIKKNIVYIVLTTIVVFGFYFRFTGISTSHSLWGDEAEIASDARDLAYGKDTLSNVIRRSGTSYQPASMLIQAVMIKMFGENEMFLRLPYIMAGATGIAVIFFVTTALSTPTGGLLAAFLFAFSQLNLANHTQAKPYTFIQVLFLLQIYFLTKLHKKNNWKIHILIILINSLAILFHTLGILIWIPYFVYLLSNKNLYTNKKLVFGVLVIFGVLAFAFRDIIAVLFINDFFAKNDFVYLKQLLVNRYGLIFLPATFGLYYIFKKNKPIAIGLSIYSLIVLYLLFFKQYVHNLRYLVPFFGIIFMCYGVFWGTMGERFKRNFIILIFSILILGISKQLVLTPQNYYSPNKDFYGDVQIADYQTMFTEIKKRFPNYRNIIIFNDWLDPQRWYLYKSPDTYFMKGAKGEIHIKDSPHRVYGNLSDFLKEKEKYPQGLLVVEDWQSILPDDIKQYAKKNMKLELRVDCMQVARDNGHCGKAINDITSNGNIPEPVLTSNVRTNNGNESNGASNNKNGNSDIKNNTDDIDRWPLELYSWGL